MNPSQMRGFFVYLVPYGFYQPYFQESKVKMQFTQNPRFGDKHLSIKAWKFILNLIGFIYKVSFHTKNPKFHTFGFSIFFLFLFFSSLLFPLSLYGFSLKNETNFGLFNPIIAKALFGLPTKPIFGSLSLFAFWPITHAIYK